MKQNTSIDGIDLSEPRPGGLLAPKAYTSPLLYEAELDRIFARSWVHVADTTDLQKAGDFVASKIGDTPVIVLRGEDGEIRTFLNACRHRGAMLASGLGNCGRSLNCPYHAWSYGSDGRLLGIPEREEFSVDPETMGLIAVRTGVTAPFVFACLDKDAPELKDWLGDLPAALEASGGSDVRMTCEYTYDVDVNWKVYVENGLEGYHVRFVHDMLDDFVETDSARHHFEEHSSYTEAFVREEFSLDLPALEHLQVDGRPVSRFGHAFPNLIPVVSPTSISYLRIDPLGPEKVRLVSRSFAKDVAPELIAYMRESLDRTNLQDIEAVLRVQQGVHARGLPAGNHAAFLEGRIGHFQRMVRRALRGSEESVAVAETLNKEQAIAKVD